MSAKHLTKLQKFFKNRTWRTEADLRSYLNSHSDLFTYRTVYVRANNLTIFCILGLGSAEHFFLRDKQKRNLLTGKQYTVVYLE